MRLTSLDLSNYVAQFHLLFPELRGRFPWEITSNASSILSEELKKLSNDFRVHNSVAIHKDALIEEHAVIKGPAIISAGCFIAAHSYLRGGVWLGEHVVIGPGSEVKSSFLLSHTSLAHFNFVGDSIVGSHVNMEAGSVIANHYNERSNKIIYVRTGIESLSTGADKFGALIGDHTKIGANAVLSPGTILAVKSVVDRLTLLQQNP